MGENPALSGWAQCHHSVLIRQRGGQGVRRRRPGLKDAVLLMALTWRRGQEPRNVVLFPEAGKGKEADFP